MGDSVIQSEAGRRRVRISLMTTYRFSVVIEEDEDGFYAYCPDLQGCYTQGKTYAEALRNIQDALRLHVQDRLEPGNRR